MRVANVEMILGALLATASWAVVELFCRADGSGLWDVLKLIVQFAGALLIAWLAVRWALGRFKSEKAWERETAALADVLSALREMYRVLGRWERQELERAELSESAEKKLRKRYATAKSKFEEVSAVAIMLLPQEAADRIETLEAGLSNGNYDTWLEQIESESAMIADTLTWLIDYSKQFRR
jgi:hypothetical protein